MAYATLAELRSQLGIVSSDTTRDALLTQALDSVSEAINHACGRSFEAATGTATTRIYPSHRVQRVDGGLLIPTSDIGSSTGLQVESRSGGGEFSTFTGDVELWPLEDVARGWAATGVLMSGASVATGAGARIRVTADWGWPGAVNAVVKQATLLQASRIFKRKDSPEGVLGSAEWGAVRVSRVDPDVDAMIQPLRLDVALVG